MKPRDGDFLRVPPFPKSQPFSGRAEVSICHEVGPIDDLDSVIEQLRSAQVGGTYWGRRPTLPPATYTLVKLQDPDSWAKLLQFRTVEHPVVWWQRSRGRVVRPPVDAISILSGECDPWYMVDQAAAVVTDADDELALVAALKGVPLVLAGEGKFKGLAGERCPADALRTLLSNPGVLPATYGCPFTGASMTVSQMLDLCTSWRDLIRANQGIHAALGFARWKQATVGPLLWDGGGGVRFISRASGAQRGERVAIWKSRAPGSALETLERRGVSLIEVEDGFIRSSGLGANCVPPLSIVVDELGIYFDPCQPSELEELLENASFSPDLLLRAQGLRETIVAGGVSKYGSDQETFEREPNGERYVLVPGQVEDDRSVLSGGGAVSSNLELLRRARREEPDAHLIYKPHPDVEAGHRVGAIPDAVCLEFADEIVRDRSVVSLINAVDAIHVNTSQAGFDGLLRGKAVTTHGVPFYAGWGLTRDLGAVPARRTARRSLDELVAATLILYPRYLDPVTGLPCPPEVLLQRLSSVAVPGKSGALVRMRQLQGLLKQRFSTLRSGKLA